MKRFSLLLLAMTFCAMPCQAQFLKDLGKELLGGAGGQQMQQQQQTGAAGTPAGSTSLPPGQYMMTHMGTGQGYYVMVDNNGQMYASVPQGNQAPAAQSTGGPLGGALGGLVPQMNGQTQPQQQQQQQGGFGGFVKGTLNNMIKNQLSPAQGTGAFPAQQQY